MKTTFRSILAAILVALTPLAALGEGQPAGGFPVSSMSRTGRAFTYHIPSVRNNVSPLTVGTCVVNSSTVGLSTVGNPQLGDLGRDGWVANMPFSSTNITQTTSVGAPLYPSKLMVDFYDSATTGTLACTSLTISGYRWDGAPITEVLNTLTETVRYTSNSFSSVTRVAAVGCTGWSGQDRLRLRTSQWVALPYRVTSVDDLDSVCAVPTTQVTAIAATSPNAQKCLRVTSSNFTVDLSPAANAINTLLAVPADASSASTANQAVANPNGYFHPTSSGCAADRASFTIRGRANPRETRF